MKSYVDTYFEGAPEASASKSPPVDCDALRSKTIAVDVFPSGSAFATTSAGMSSSNTSAVKEDAGAREVGNPCPLLLIPAPTPALVDLALALEAPLVVEGLVTGSESIGGVSQSSNAGPVVLPDIDVTNIAYRRGDKDNAERGPLISTEAFSVTEVVSMFPMVPDEVDDAGST